MLLLQPCSTKSYLVRYLQFGLFPFRSSLLRESQLISFPLLLRYFSSQCVLLLCREYGLPVLGSPIRKSWSNNAFYQLLQAYRRFIRPSSDIRVKASTLCYMLNLNTTKTINHFSLSIIIN